MQLCCKKKTINSTKAALGMRNISHNDLMCLSGKLTNHMLSISRVISRNAKACVLALNSPLSQDLVDIRRAALIVAK